MQTENAMPKVKVPERLKELADELNLNLGEDAEDTERVEDVIAWMKGENEAQRAEENEHRDHIDNELDALEAEMLEEVDDA
jgi:hypothetical protein